MEFIDVVRQLDPLDPAVLKRLEDGSADHERLINISGLLGARTVAVSLANLEIVGLARRGVFRTLM